jgi:CheY-like chemotaxis protein
MMEEVKPLIMVVDDQPDNVRLVRLILEQDGYKVWTAINGEHALERLEAALTRRRRQRNFGQGVKYLPDLILSDIIMPIMDGYTFYERTRSNPYLNHIPFIFLTAKADSSDIRRGRELGVDDYLIKPTQPDDLRASVRGKLRRVSQRRALAAQFVGDSAKPPVLGVVFLIAFVMIVIIVTVAITLMLAS